MVLKSGAGIFGLNRLTLCLICLLLSCKSDFSEPSFQKSLDFIPRSSKDEVAAMLRGLNRTQRQAIKRVLLSNDYTLVVGKLLLSLCN